MSAVLSEAVSDLRVLWIVLARAVSSVVCAVREAVRESRSVSWSGEMASSGY